MIVKVSVCKVAGVTPAKPANGVAFETGHSTVVE